MSHPPHSQTPISRPPTPTPPSPAPLASSSRATTAPVKSKHHLSHHPHRLHHHRGVPQSATQPSSSTNLGDGLTPIVSRAGARNEGSAETQEKVREREREKDREKEREAEAGKWKAVEEKREGRRKVDETLRQTLHSLTLLSTSTTRRLDYTYYSLLSHVSTLATLTSALSTLYATTESSSGDFGASVGALASTVDAHTSAVEGTFEAHARRIEGLESRLARGRRRVGELGCRLEAVRVRVEGWERGEREWAGRARMRVRMLWGAVGVVVGLFLVLLVVRRAPGGDGALGVGGERGRGDGIIIAGAGLGTTISEGGVHEVWPEGSSTTSKALLSISTSTSTSTPAIADDPRLKLLDEL